MSSRSVSRTRFVVCRMTLRSSATVRPQFFSESRIGLTFFIPGSTVAAPKTRLSKRGPVKSR